MAASTDSPSVDEPSPEDLALLEQRQLSPEEWRRRFEVDEDAADGITFEIAEPDEPDPDES